MTHVFNGQREAILISPASRGTQSSRATPPTPAVQLKCSPAFPAPPSTGTRSTQESRNRCAKSQTVWPLKITIRREFHNNSATRSRAKFNSALDELWNEVPEDERLKVLGVVPERPSPSSKKGSKLLYHTFESSTWRRNDI